ncbi:MAG: hypothetical protein JRC60_09140 [Deltaproteobacteria bacterium]|nr:hypothetical protein [Deltaproteobacteria bacterium]
MIEETIRVLNDLDFDYLDMYEKSAAEKERDIQVAELERIKRVPVFALFSRPKRCIRRVDMGQNQSLLSYTKGDKKKHGQHHPDGKPSAFPRILQGDTKILHI